MTRLLVIGAVAAVGSAVCGVAWFIRTAVGLTDAFDRDR